MRKQFAKLTKTQREKTESAYHRMKPSDFDQTMVGAKRVRPTAARSKPKIRSSEKKRAA